MIERERARARARLGERENVLQELVLQGYSDRLSPGVLAEHFAVRLTHKIYDVITVLD